MFSEGRERRVRWRVVRAAVSAAREGAGEEMALVVGSMCRGRRVNVSSIVENGRG